MTPVEDSGKSDITKKQAVILEEMEGQDVHMTVRSLADRLEKRAHRSERFTDAEVRGLLERLEAKGLVEQFGGLKGEQRYRLK